MKTQKTGQSYCSSRGRKTGKCSTFVYLLFCIPVHRKIPSVTVAGYTEMDGINTGVCVFYRAFEDVFVSWRATFSLTAPALLSQGVNLTQELQQTSGRVLCRRGQALCLLHLEVRPDQVYRQEEAVCETNISFLISQNCLKFSCPTLAKTTLQASC